MEQYVSFSDDAVFGSVALPEGFFGIQTPILKDSPDTLPACTHIPSKEVPMEEVAPVEGSLEEPITTWVPHKKWAKMEVPPNWFPSWEKVLHPSQLVTTMGQVPPAYGELKQRYCHRSSEARRAPCQRVEEQVQAGQEERDSSSPGIPKPMHVVAPLPSFKEVTACLQGDLSPAIAIKVPLEFMQPEAVVEPAIATMCASHVVQGEAFGVTYMETVTTSVGWVALNCTCPMFQNPHLTIRDITDLPKEEGDNNCL